MSLTVQSRRQSLTPELTRLNREIEEHAREYGLDFYETFFEILDFEEMNMVAAYGGFPNRYPHWKFGMEYERLNKSYAYGLHKIYEMVINNDPCYAYLLECNHLVDQKLVMAHVYGHCDFFKNNIWFSKTNRKMMDTMANHATKVRKYIDKYGLDAVESFIDICLSIDDLIDHHSVFIERKAKPREGTEEPIIIKKIASSEYMDDFINPKEFMDQQKQKLEEERQRRRRFPEQPQKDILLFLIEHGPLENWQRDILWMIREEAYYFAPQAQTKIMNEGWATYWHAKIMTERALNDAEVIIRELSPLIPDRSIRTGWASSYGKTSRIAGTKANSARITTSATITSPNANGISASAWAVKRSLRPGGFTTTSLSSTRSSRRSSATSTNFSRITSMPSAAFMRLPIATGKA